jgi:N-acetylglucosamine kinase-like BadF-type ATPase
VVLGVDGGGSHTRAWIAHEDGTVVGRGMAGPSNVHVLGVDASRRVIVEAVTAAWRAMGAPGERPCGFRAVFAGVAGAGAFDDQRALSSALAADFGLDPANCRVDHDLRVALAGALGGRPGAVLVAGTGSACFGAVPDGRTWKAGGWGAQLDDGGSGHWLGLQALRAVVRAADGRGMESTLTGMVSARIGMSEPRAIIQALANGGLTREAVAALAPDVLAAAEAGDAVAVDIVERGAVELAAMVAAVWRALGLASEPKAALAGTGSVLEKGLVYRKACADALAKEVPGVVLAEPHLPSVAGAVLLALQVAGVSTDGPVMARLRVAAGS